MKVTLRWTDAMGRLCKQIADLVEEEGRVSYGDLAWLGTLMKFRTTARHPSSEDMDRIALMFDDSGLAGVLLGEEHFPALEERKIKSILLTDKRAVHCPGAQRARSVGAELIMGVPSYPENWRH